MKKNNKYRFKSRFTRRNIIKLIILFPFSPRSSLAHNNGSPVIWNFDNLKNIGGYKPEIIGSPRVMLGDFGPEVFFNGSEDGIQLDCHPLERAAKFTIEAVLRPDGGASQQRWLHLESVGDPPGEAGTSRDRILFEIRVLGNNWYSDAFVHGENYHKALMEPADMWPVGQWHHVAQTYDGSTFSSYVNGRLQASAAIPFVPQGAGRSSVGMRLNRVNFFHGAIRNIRFSRVALLPSQFSGFEKKTI